MFKKKSTFCPHSAFIFFNVHQNKEPLLPTFHKEGGFYNPSAVCVYCVSRTSSS